ncbi:MAG: hypothetical protein WCJ62_05270 [Flavobacterium sp.]
MNFKKHISLFLAVLLLVSSMGLAFTIHYCDNEIAAVSINTASNAQEIEKGCCGVVEKESKCCKNKIIKSHEKSDQITVRILALDTNYHWVCNDWKPIVFSNEFHFDTKAFPSYFCDAHAPPLYLLYSQYTFYA